MLEFLGLQDNKKIGLTLIAISVFLNFFAVILFFPRSLLILSNIFFLSGLYFFIGLTGVFKFFIKKAKIKGSILFFIGFILIFINFGFFGATVQFIGMFLIFRKFLPDLYDYLCKIPFLGNYLKSYWIQNILQKIAGTQSRI